VNWQKGPAGVIGDVRRCLIFTSSFGFFLYQGQMKKESFSDATGERSRLLMFINTR